MAIQAGDIVHVYREDRIYLMRAEVLSVPCATGDGWRFKDLSFGHEIWTSEPISIWKYEEDQG